MTIKIEIPSDNEFKPLAAAIGLALYNFGNGITTEIGVTIVTNTTTTTAGDASIKEEVKVLTTADVAKAANAETAVKLNSAEGATDSTSGKSQATTNQGGAAQQGAGDAQGVHSGAADSSLTDGNDNAKLDDKGVGFNEKICGNAAKPFYGSGKTKGQWKRKQGVDQADYDAWYDASLALASQDQQEKQVDTSAAFSGQDQGQGDNVAQINTAAAFAGRQNGEVVNDGQNHQEQHQDGKTFKDAGEFMQWLAEQQAAENITAGDIDSAYASTQCTMGDLFDPAKAANAIALVYNFLSNIAEGQ